MIAIGIFLIFGACMAALAGITLLWQGTVLDKAWSLNKAAHRQLSALGQTAGIFFFLLCATLGAASVGWFKRRFWGWGLAVGIIATQVVGDFVNVIRGDFLRGGTGMAIAGSLLVYLLRPKVRTVFLSRTNTDRSGS